ncbi:DNA polymerase III subunit delta' [Sphingorhabdus sp.]|uniref:DNA polymerase III subunit delta' n=1 Tax=Sphingorhabdus sp. TaxID=1902408 RepID=UPI0035941381
MTEFIGHDAAWRQFASALDSGKLHHGWILVGPRGLGKAGFARRAAAALVDPQGQYASMIERGSHPDILTIKRLPKEAAKDGEENDPDAELKRSISIDQIRQLQAALTTRPGLSNKRAIIIDAADDLERSGANALLKSLEEPPVGTYFLLVSHASDRLLPTIRSRCQLLRFEPLDQRDMAAALRQAAPEIDSAEMDAYIRIGKGAPGQAIDFMGLDLGKLEDAMTSILQTGDRSNQIRSALAEQLSLKASQPRYEAFLRLVPAFIANCARELKVNDIVHATEAWTSASALANRAITLSLDKQSVVFQMGSLLASLQPNKAT